jgi:hypothetical protein
MSSTPCLYAALMIGKFGHPVHSTTLLNNLSDRKIMCLWNSICNLTFTTSATVFSVSIIQLAVSCLISNKWTILHIGRTAVQQLVTIVFSSSMLSCPTPSSSPLPLGCTPTAMPLSHLMSQTACLDILSCLHLQFIPCHVCLHIPSINRTRQPLHKFHTMTLIISSKVQLSLCLTN